MPKMKTAISKRNKAGLDSNYLTVKGEKDTRRQSTSVQAFIPIILVKLDILQAMVNYCL